MLATTTDESPARQRMLERRLRASRPLSLDTLALLNRRADLDSSDVTPYRAPHLSGASLRRLMRKHRMTIRQLSTLAGITMKRIREVRAEGVAMPDHIGWQQIIITGDPRSELPPRLRACFRQWRRESGR